MQQYWVHSILIPFLIFDTPFLIRGGGLLSARNDLCRRRPAAGAKVGWSEKHKNANLDRMQNSEAGSTREMVEGLLNYMAVLHMIRPWDFGGLVMLRVLHEVAFFGPSARTAKEQKELVKEFCEDVMQKNCRRAITGEHPLTYRQAMKRAQEVVAGKNGMSFNLQIKADPYQSYKELKEKGEKIKKLQEEVARLKKELKEKPRARKDGGYS